ncbi:MAG: hypothetical protein HDR43_01045 [Mycoplasma sp.]|nr:hypothetical protein [Mycoplasma sp.]
MIRELIFKRTDDFNSQPITLSFSEHINVIIGPKGGGKSTLFDLLAGLKNNYISNTVIDALKEYGLKFEKAIKFSNEEILASQLTKKKNKEKIADYETRNDVIYQDDLIKKNLTSAKEIEDNKFNYIKTQVYQSTNVINFISKIKKLHESMEHINNLNKVNDINWSNTFKINELKDERDELILITKLDYKKTRITEAINQEINEYKSFENSTELFKSNLRKIEIFDKNKIIEDDKEFENKVNNLVKNINDNIQELQKNINDRKFQLDKINKTIDFFSQSYTKIINEIKAKSYLTSGLKSYEISSKNYFKNYAKDIYLLIQNFEQLISEDIYLNIENNENQKEQLKFRINDNIKLSDDSKSEILKTVFHSPGSSRDDVDKWLKSLSSKGIKEFNEERIKNCIAREIKDETKILVDYDNELKDYESLSLGQKSIYGLKYKFNRSLNQDLFLDQPEDNLDNNTIASEILELFDKKKDSQVFIVTHNANIGILSNPLQVIVANLGNKNEPYKILNKDEMINKETANYLEGGEKYLERRYKKIIENRKEV